MPHSLRSTELGFLHRSKHARMTLSNSSSVAKYRLCVAKRRANFHTRSIGASCGLYGGRNSSVRILRYLRKSGASRMAWWYRALSSTITMRLPRDRCRSNFLRNASKVTALNTSHICWMNFPVPRLTAPKQATDLRVGACSNTEVGVKSRFVA